MDTHCKKLDSMVRGWFVGNFDPVVFKTQACEVGFKTYKAGAKEEFHYHKVATEITLITKGIVEMCGKFYRAGDIIVIKPGEGTDFRAVSNVENVVVKIPGTINDKYIGKYEDKGVSK